MKGLPSKLNSQKEFDVVDFLTTKEMIDGYEMAAMADTNPSNKQYAMAQVERARARLNQNT